MRHLLICSLVVVAAASAGAQQPSREAAVPKTPWGDPDLQGVWDYWTFTPLERPKEYANKPLLTDEEAAQLGQRLRNQAVAGDSVRPTGNNNPGGYSQEAWTDRARATVLKQTSLIVDPPTAGFPR